MEKFAPHHFCNLIKLGPKVAPYSAMRHARLTSPELRRVSEMTEITPLVLQEIDFYAPGSLRKLLPQQFEAIDPRFFNDDMALVAKAEHRNYAAEYLDILPNKQEYLVNDYLFGFGKNIRTIYSENEPLGDRELALWYENWKLRTYYVAPRRSNDYSVFAPKEKGELFMWNTHTKGDYTDLVNSYTDAVWAHAPLNTYWMYTKKWNFDWHEWIKKATEDSVCGATRKNQGSKGEPDYSSFDKVLEKESIPSQNYQFEPSSINDQAINPTWYQSAATLDRLHKEWTEKKNQVNLYGDDSIILRSYRNQGSDLQWSSSQQKFVPIYRPDFVAGSLSMAYVPSVKDDRARAKRERDVKIRTFREKCDDMQIRKKIARCHKIHDAINQSLSSWNPIEILRDLLAPLAERFKKFMEGMTVVEWFGGIKQKFTDVMETFASKIHENQAFMSVWMANLIMGHHDAATFFMSIMTFISVMMPSVIMGTAELLVKLISEFATWTRSKLSATNQGSGFNLSKIFSAFYGIKVPKNLFTDIVAKLRSLSAFNKGLKDGFGMLKWIGKAFERFRIWCGIGSLSGQKVPDSEYELTQWATDISELSEMTRADMQEPQNKELLEKVIRAAAAITKHGIMEGYPAKCQVWLKASVTTVEHLSRTYHQQLRMVIPSLRPAPLWIAFSGPPGVGKSMMINRLGRALFDTRAKAPVNRVIDQNNLFYFCNTSTKYDDQYQNQPIFVIDDLFQAKSNDMTAKEDSEAMMMINAVGPVPCEVNNSQAGLKGGIALSEVYVTTSNTTYPTPPEIKDVRALHRRTAVRCWVEVDKTQEFGPDALKYYVLPSVLARSEQNKFLELEDHQELPSGYQLMTEASWEVCKKEVLRQITPMSEREFIRYTISVWHKRVDFSANNAFNDDFADDFFDGPAPIRVKISPLTKPILTTPDIRTNQGLPLAAKVQMCKPLIEVMAGCYLIGSASHHLNPMNEQVSLILGCLLLISFIWSFMVPFINILRNQGNYSHDKNTVARATPRLRSPQVITWKNNGNLANTRDQIRQMCVKLTLRCGDQTYSFAGLAYGGQDIIVNEHCLGLLYDNPDEHVTINVINYQNFDRTYAIDTSMVLESDSDLCVLRIKDMPNMKMRDHLICETLPNHGTQMPVATYCMRTQTFSHSKAQMFATGPNDIPKNKPPPPGAQFFTADVYDYYYCHFITVADASMKPGDCGSPVIDLQSGKIMGIHVATSGDSDDYIPFTRNQLPVRPSLKVPDTEIIEQGEYNGVRAEHLNYVARKTNLKKSVIHGTFPVKKAPAALSRSHPNGDPLYVNFFKGFEGNEPYPIDDVDYAVEFVSSKVKTYEASPLGRRELSDHETLNGMEGVYNGMILSTSMGTPYKDNAQKSGKYDAIDMIDGVRYWSDTPLSKEIQRRIVEVEADLQKGIVPCEYMTEQLKDEAVSLAKVEIGKTRTFRTLTIVMNYLYRKYFGAMVAAVEQHPDMNEVALGLNVHGHHWTRLYHRLNKFGGNVLAGDYANWDRSLSAQLIRTLKKICTAFYGYESLARDTLIDYLISAPVIVENLVFFPFQGLPSGVAMTTLFGSLINFVVIVLAIAHILRKEGKLHLLSHENIELTFYGDDHIVAVHPALQEYVTFQRVKAFMTKHGLGYTPADKSDRVFDFEGLQEVPYLKRTFKPISPMMVQAPLEMASIENMVQWQDRRLPEIEFVKAVWTSICQESVYHGTEKFSEITQKVQTRIFEECDRRGWDRPVLNADYRQWYNNWIASRI